MEIFKDKNQPVTSNGRWGIKKIVRSNPYKFIAKVRAIPNVKAFIINMGIDMNTVKLNKIAITIL